MALSIVRCLKRRGRIEQDALAAAFAQEFVREPNRGYGGMAQQILFAINEGMSWKAVASRAFGVAIVRVEGGVVGRTDGVIGAQATELPSFAQVVAQPTAFFDQAAERAFAASGAGAEQDAGHGRRIFFSGAAEDSFADRSCRVAAFEANCRQNEV